MVWIAHYIFNRFPLQKLYFHGCNWKLPQGSKLWFETLVQMYSEWYPTNLAATANIWIKIILRIKIQFGVQMVYRRIREWMTKLLKSSGRKHLLVQIMWNNIAWWLFNEETFIWDNFEFYISYLFQKFPVGIYCLQFTWRSGIK